MSGSGPDLCREGLITLAQTVYCPEKHGLVDGVKPRKTDANRILEVFLQIGSSNEIARKHVRASFDLANHL